MKAVVKIDEKFLEVVVSFGDDLGFRLPLNRVSVLDFFIKEENMLNINKLSRHAKFLPLNLDDSGEVRLPRMAKSSILRLNDLIQKMVKNCSFKDELRLVESKKLSAPYGHYTSAGREILIKKIKDDYLSITDPIVLDHFSFSELNYEEEFKRLKSSLKRNYGFRNKIKIYSLTWNNIMHTSTMIYYDNNIFVFDSAGHDFNGTDNMSVEPNLEVALKLLKENKNLNLFLNLNRVQNDGKSCCVFAYDLIKNLCVLYKNIKKNQTNPREKFLNYLKGFFDVPIRDLKTIDLETGEDYTKDIEGRIFCEGDIMILTSAMIAFNENELKDLQQGCRRKIILPPEFFVNVQNPEIFIPKVKSIAPKEINVKELKYNEFNPRTKVLSEKNVLEEINENSIQKTIKTYYNKEISVLTNTRIDKKREEFNNLIDDESYRCL